VYPVLGLMDFNPAVTAQSKKDLKKALMVLEKHLLYRTYIVGDKVTLADIVTACALLYPMRMVMDAKYRKSMPSVTRWFLTVVNQPEFAAVMGVDVPLCEEELVASGAPVSSGKKGKKGKKAAAGGAGGKKKEKKAAAAPAPAPAKKTKPKDPLADLPKSTMIMDVWKKTYSNERTNGYYTAMPKFWEMLDREGYSIWFQTYNYNADNVVDFQTSNLVGGYVQRCDAIRKYAFGAMQIFNGPPYDIEGCWLIRGTSIQPMLDNNPDAEYYTWTQMNPDDEAQRERVGHLWCAAEKIGDKSIYDCKIFK
jgi:elongation factor 1-gamma